MARAPLYASSRAMRPVTCWEKGGRSGAARADQHGMVYAASVLHATMARDRPVRPVCADAPRPALSA